MFFCLLEDSVMMIWHQNITFGLFLLNPCVFKRCSFGEDISIRGEKSSLIKKLRKTSQKLKKAGRHEMSWALLHLLLAAYLFSFRVLLAFLRQLSHTKLWKERVNRKLLNSGSVIINPNHWLGDSDREDDFSKNEPCMSVFLSLNNYDDLHL